MSNTRLWHTRQGPIRAVSTFPFRKTCSILFLCFIHFENHVTFKHQFPWNQFYSIQFPKLWVANNIIRHDKKISLSWGIKSFALVLLPLITNLFLCVGFFPQSKSNWILNKRVNCVCALWCTRDLSKLYLQPLPYCMWAGSGHKWTLVTPVGIMDGWMMIKACSRVPYCIYPLERQAFRIFFLWCFIAEALKQLSDPSWETWNFFPPTLRIMKQF